MRILYHIARADFLERVRRYGFLITLLLGVYGAWGFVPPNDSTVSTLTIKGTRGVYNSAWVGAQVALLTSVFLTMVGFYLVKNSIDRDYQTRVGQILSATPMTRLKYTIGKMFSNAAVLWSIVAVMVVVAGFMQYVRAEDRTIHLVNLIAPFAYSMIPMGLLIGSLAVLFECVGRLRGGLGNIVYFFLFISAVSSSLFDTADIFGIGAYTDSMRATAAAAFPDAIGPDVEMNMGIHIQDSGNPRHLETFRWEGVDFSLGMIAGRFVVVLIAFGLAGVASLLFDRFDSLRAIEPAHKKPSWADRLVSRVEEMLTPSRKGTFAGPVAQLTPLSTGAANPRLLKTALAELRIMLKGQHAIWYLGVLAAIIVGLLVPTKAGQSVVLPIAWLWPVLTWSQLGCREVRQGTSQYIFSTARPVARQLPAAWLAGAITAIIVGGGVGLHLLVSGNLAGVATWFVGALFVPALALACGAWTGGAKLFEVIYIFWWYAGPLNRVPALDFMGASGELHTPATTVGYGVVTLILLGLAVLGRRRQLYV